MNEQELEKKLTAAYDKMVERINHLFEAAEQKAIPTLEQNLEKAQLQAVELKEITQEEAEKIAQYLRRDIQSAATYLRDSGKEFSTWFQFDVKLIEARLIEIFSKVADKSRVEQSLLATQARLAVEYRTGEIASIGTLSCNSCGSVLNFKKTSRIPPCPRCHKTVFTRKTD
jgi:predicted Zn-ribbon and HTH transcriptional regulator